MFNVDVDLTAFDSLAIQQVTLQELSQPKARPNGSTGRTGRPLSSIDNQESTIKTAFGI
jgi:hypothetical protein